MKETMDCHKALKICYGLFFGGLACVLLALWVKKGPLLFLLGIPGLVVMFVGLLFGVLFVRCPHCGVPLTRGRLPSVPDYCPYCGEKLKKETQEK